MGIPARVCIYVCINISSSPPGCPSFCPLLPFLQSGWRSSLCRLCSSCCRHTRAPPCCLNISSTPPVKKRKISVTLTVNITTYHVLTKTITTVLSLSIILFTNMEEHSISLTESPHYNHNPPNVFQVFLRDTSRTCGNCKSDTLNQNPKFMLKVREWVFHSKVTTLTVLYCTMCIFLTSHHFLTFKNQ